MSSRQPQLPTSRPAREPSRGRKGRHVLGWCWLAACLFLATCLAGGVLRQRASAPPSPQSSTQQGLGRACKPIEAIRVGERVWADNPDVPVTAASQVDSARWRRLTLRIDARWEDGTPDEVRIETLQPPSWVRRQGAQVGALVPVPLDLQEMGLPEGLRARVLANEPCPAIAPSPGCVVLTTVSHLNRDVRELTVTDAFGRQESFRPTSFHKFYRHRDKAWVSAKELRRGDQLRGRFGLLTVVVNKQVPGIHRVYNMTVEGEHVYHVSSLGALAHNMDCTPAPNAAKAKMGSLSDNGVGKPYGTPAQNGAKAKMGSLSDNGFGQPHGTPAPKTTASNPVAYEKDAIGRTTRAEGIIEGSHPRRGKGYRPEPMGGRNQGDHRGHLIPENGVKDPKGVNGKDNIIAEARGSNLGPKKVFENEAIGLANQNPNSVVQTIHEPLYNGNDLRPYAVRHTITIDGKVVKTVTIPNQ